MTQKSQSEASKSNDTDGVTDSPFSILTHKERMCLVASVAGSVAAGIVMAPSKKVTAAAAVAEIAVDIAEEIVKRSGL